MFYLAIQPQQTQPDSLHSDLKLLHTLVIYIVWLPVEHTRVIHNSSPVAPRDVCLSSVKLHIFTAPAASACPILRNCLSRLVGPADVVAAAQMIYSGEESLGLKLDTTGADTFRVGIVCVADGRALGRAKGWRS